MTRKKRKDKEKKRKKLLEKYMHRPQKKRGGQSQPKTQFESGQSERDYGGERTKEAKKPSERVKLEKLGKKKVSGDQTAKRKKGERDGIRRKGAGGMRPSEDP